MFVMLMFAVLAVSGCVAVEGGSDPAETDVAEIRVERPLRLQARKKMLRSSPIPLRVSPLVL